MVEVGQDGEETVSMLVTPEQQEEYDRFGPWLLEIRSEADMPPCFRDHYPTHAQARFLLKVPIPVERRNARPGMDLYRTVLAVDGDAVHLLSRERDRTFVRSIALKEIQGIRVFQRLLQGKLTLYRGDGTGLEFTYNAVSQPLVDAIVDHLRSNFPGDNRGKPRRALVEVEDFYFKNVLDEHRRREPSALPMHYEAPDRPMSGFWRWRTVTLGFLALATDQDLVLIDQGKGIRRRKEAVYVCRTTFVPWSAFHGMSEDEATCERKMRMMILRMGATAHLAFELSEPAALLRSLEPC